MTWPELDKFINTLVQIRRSEAAIVVAAYGSWRAYLDTQKACAELIPPEGIEREGYRITCEDRPIYAQPLRERVLKQTTKVVHCNSIRE